MRTREPRTDETPPRASGFAIDAQPFAAPRAEPGLYVVATPIGNLADITLRALRTLAGADVIACEDTRVTRVLLERYAIRTPMTAYHEHNAEKARPRLLDLLEHGGSIALVSDAGTPLVSDPGYRLVRAAIEAGHAVHPIPGPSALLAALTIAGQPTDGFHFAGFLPAKAGARRGRIEALARSEATLILYESPHRLGATLADLADLLGAGREAAVTRELTKKFEEAVRGPLGALAERYADETPKGEIVIVIGPAQPVEVDRDDTDGLLVAALARMAPAKAAGEVARMTGADRRALYARALDLKAERGGQNER